MVVPGCSLARRLLDLLFVLFAGLGCTDCTVPATSEASWGGQQELQHQGGLACLGQGKGTLPLGLWLNKDLRKKGCCL